MPNDCADEEYEEEAASHAALTDVEIEASTDKLRRECEFDDEYDQELQSEERASRRDSLEGCDDVEEGDLEGHDDDVEEDREAGTSPGGGRTSVEKSGRTPLEGCMSEGDLDDEVHVTDSSGGALKRAIAKHLGPDYMLRGNVHRLQMRLLVFVRKGLVRECSQEERAAENTGIGHVVANKGGQVFTIKVRNTRLAFVACHLNAHEGEARQRRRNADCAAILSGARVGDRNQDVTMQVFTIATALCVAARGTWALVTTTLTRTRDKLLGRCTMLSGVVT
jgi:hypothetical protein